MKLPRCFPLLAGILLGFAPLTAIHADTALYTFDGPQFTVGESTPIDASPDSYNGLLAAALTADFTGAPTADDFTVGSGRFGSPFAGNYLTTDDSSGVLTVTLNEPATTLSLNYVIESEGSGGFLSVTINGVTTNFTTTTTNDGYQSGSVSFTPAQAFTSFEVSAFQNEATHAAQAAFSMDDLGLTVVPEPSAWAWALGGFVLLGGARCFRRARPV